MTELLTNPFQRKDNSGRYNVYRKTHNKFKKLELYENLFDRLRSSNGKCKESQKGLKGNTTVISTIKERKHHSTW